MLPTIAVDFISVLLKASTLFHQIQTIIVLMQKYAPIKVLTYSLFELNKPFRIN